MLRPAPLRSATVRRAALLLLLGLLASLVGPAPLVLAASGDAVVNTTDDDPDTDLSDGVCETGGIAADESPACSLRAAIQQANASAGPNTITFNIPASDAGFVNGVYRIRPATPLPIVTQPTVIDGLSQPGASCAAWPPTLQIELSGDGIPEPTLGNTKYGLRLEGGDSVVRGLVVNGFFSTSFFLFAGIELRSDNNQLACNFIGTDPAGTSAQRNNIGINIDGDNNIIGTDGDGVNDAAERNLISGNDQPFGTGVQIRGGENNRVAGNYIGTNAAGSDALGNTIGIESSVRNTVIGVNGDGSPGEANEGNLISGNTTLGVSLRGTVDTRVSGNLIGLNAAGTAQVSSSVSGPPFPDGVWVDVDPFGNGGSTNTLIGTDANGVSDTLERNVFAGGNGRALEIRGDATTGTRVAGNYFGTNAVGTAAVSSGDGIVLRFGPDNSIIGTNGDGVRDAIERNVFVGHSTAIGVGGGNSPITGNRISGNYIGLLPDGVTAGPNSIGIRVQNAVDGLVIGTDGDGSPGDANEGNIIAANSFTGLRIANSDGFTLNNIRVAGNAIGIAADGTTASGNGQNGIVVATFGGASTGLLIGGDTAVEANRIANNVGNGIVVLAPNTGVRIQRNSIFANSGIGIDLGDDGPTINDAADPDDGPNRLQNYPTISNVSLSGTDLSLTYSVDSAPANASYPLTVEFFAVDNNASNEGRTFLGTDSYTAADAAAGEKTVTLPNVVALGYTAGRRVVATASDGVGNSSEFTILPVVIDPPAEITVTDQNSVSISDGQAAPVDFGTTIVGTPVDHSFTIANTGGQDLALGALTLPPGFVLLGTFPTGPLAPGATASFTVRLAATSAGSFSGQLAFINGDEDRSPFNFPLTGQVQSLNTPGTLQLSAPSYTLNEDGTPIGAAVTVTRSDGSAGAVSATISFTGGTAQGSTPPLAFPADYDNTPIVVSFADGDTSDKTVIIPLLDDVAAEPDETIALSLTGPTGGATLGAQTSATVTVPAADTTVVTTNDDNQGTLRQAIINANDFANQQTIGFAIPGTGVQTIAVQAALPAITDSVVIDGFTQSGGVCAPGGDSPPIALDGQDLSGDEDGLRFEAGADASAIFGLAVQRFGGDAVVFSDVFSPTVSCNQLGAGSGSGFGSEGDGLVLSGVLGGFIIGNVIADNEGDGIALLNGSRFIRILGNSIGLGANGTAALGNGGSGIYVNAADVSISGNLIGANGEHGIHIQGVTTEEPPPEERSFPEAGPRSLTLPGQLGRSTVEIFENRIGTDADFAADLGNQGAGVLVEDSQGVAVGDAILAAGNIIGYNRVGVAVIGESANNPISGNSIDLNDGLGIDLGDDGITANDPGDGDSGPNGRQNVPIITSAIANGMQLTVNGTLNSTPDSGFLVEIFVSPAADPSGAGEGREYVGSFELFTDSNGEASFSHVVENYQSDGQVLSLTATGAEGTSEFSAAIPLSGPQEIAVFDGADSATGTPIASGQEAPVDFGSTTVGTPVVRTFTVRNLGGQELTLGSPTLPAGFALVGSFPAGPVAPRSEATFQLQLTAAAVGNFSGTLSFANNDGDENPFSFPIVGVVTAVPAPEIALFDGASAAGEPIANGQSSPIAFGSTTVGTPVARSFAIRNLGTAPLTLSPASLVVPAGFALVGEFPAGPLAPGTEATFRLALVAAASGNFGGNVSFANNDSDENPFSFAVSGSVTAAPAPEIAVFDGDSATGTAITSDQTAPIAFGSTPVGTAVSRTFTIRNLGTAPLLLDPSSLALPAGFALVGSFPAGPIAPNGAASFTLRLAAASVGSFSGTVAFLNSDSDESPFRFPVSGTVSAAPAQLFRVYLPLVAKPQPASTLPDLVVTSLTVSPQRSSFRAGEPVVVTVVVQNQGNAPAGPFWVDLSVNPRRAPQTNDLWHDNCGLSPCVGAAWAVRQSLAPGQSVTLTTVAGFDVRRTFWPGWLPSGATTLYAFADSWNSAGTTGTVQESDETNNRGELGGLSVTGTNPPVQPWPGATLDSAPAVPGLPNRPTVR